VQRITQIGKNKHLEFEGLFDQTHYVKLLFDYFFIFINNIEVLKVMCQSLLKVIVDKKIYNIKSETV